MFIYKILNNIGYWKREIYINLLSFKINMYFFFCSDKKENLFNLNIFLKHKN